MLGFVLDDYQDQGELPLEELNGLMDAMSEAEAGLFRKMLGGGLFELMGSDGSFEFGLNLILLGIEQVIKEQE